ncbi:MAG: hypothetical protein KAI63_02155, partial [Planctomycetes bacterium]|nr:hypothetical protein [Planctomycetota bacterium]
SDVEIGQKVDVLSGTNTFNWPNDDNDAVGSNVTFKIKDPSDSDVTSDAANNVKIVGDFTGIELTKSGSPVTVVMVNDSVQVEWTGEGTVPYVKIEYSNDGFVDAGNIWNMTPVSTTNFVGANSYTWTVDDNISSVLAYKIRISDYNDATVTNTSDAPFKIRGDFNVTAPSGGQVWYVGENTRVITWTTFGDIGWVDLEYSKDGVSWSTLKKSDGSDATGVANNGNGTTGLTITVPDAITNTFRMRVVYPPDSSVYDASNTLVVKGRLVVDVPDSTDMWYIGDNQPITWTATGSIPANVKLEYYDGTGVGSWEPIPGGSSVPVTTTGNQGSFTWNNLPDLIRNDVKVRVTQIGDPGVTDNSDDFKIRGKLQVNEPDGGETYLIYHGTYQDQTFPITYTVTGSIADVDIDYFNGVSWTNITTMSPGASGTYGLAWQVPDDITKSALIRVVDQLYPGDSDATSPSNFEIRGQVNVTEPGNTELWWSVGDLDRTIYWSTVGSIGSVKVQYRSAVDGNWVDIATVGTTPGVINSHNWDWAPGVGVANAITTTARVRIEPILALNNADPDQSPDFNIRTKIAVGSLTTGDILRVCDSWVVTYTYTGTVNTVKVQSSVNGLPYQDIDTGITDGDGTGQYTWNPISDTISNNVRIKVLDNDAGHPLAENGISNQCKIKGKIIVNSPNGGEDWSVSQTYPITWTIQGSVSEVEIKYATDGINFNDSITITNSNPGPNVYNWTIPDDTTTSSSFKIRVMSTVDPTGTLDDSNSIFTVKGFLQITYPAGGEVLTVGNSLEIQWDKNSGLSTVGLLFAQDGSTFNENIPFGAPISHQAGAGTNGSFIWGVPDRLSPNARIKIYDWDNATVEYTSNPFRIRGDLSLGNPDTGWQEWIVDSPQSITWTMSGSISSLNIYYSTDNFATITNTIEVGVPAGPLQRPWFDNVADDITSGYDVRVKITDADYEATQDVSEFPFKIRGQIDIDPAVTGIWTVGTVHPITWTTTGTMPNVKITYSTDGGLSFPNSISDTVACGVGGEYVYYWTVPNLPSNPQVQIKVADKLDSTTTFDTTANITVQGTINVTFPQDQDVLLVGVDTPISWTWVGIIPNVDISYSIDAAHVEWTPIITGTANTGSFTWNVEDDISDTVRIRVRNSDDSTVGDDSPDPGEAIIRGRFNISSPNGDETFISGTTVPITWTSVGTMISVKLEYTKVGDFSDGLSAIETSTANDGSYDWLIPPMISSQVKVRVSYTTDSDAKDESNGVFEVKGDLKM